VAVDLDPAFFGQIDDFEARFPEGVPSLAEATALTVRGDVRFGGGVRVVGAVTVEAPPGETLIVARGALLGPA
jgi:UTP--glucose-1-phosphate uridylyltransferase